MHEESQEQQILARPRTWLQSGIQKEKVHIDGIVKYNFLGKNCLLADIQSGAIC